MRDPGDRRANLAMLRSVHRRHGWLSRIRPQVLAEPLYRLLGPVGTRAIVDYSGVRLFIDPFSTLGRTIVEGGEFEPETARLVRESVPRGGTFLDVGANEGVFSALALAVAGPEGRVLAIEPQSRLCDVIEINLALNGGGPNSRIFRNAVADTDGRSLVLNLGPTSHSGGSSIAGGYRWSNRRETVTSRSIDSILAECGDLAVDLMKVDVEGFEDEVIASAASSLANGRITTLSVDYHGALLAKRGIEPAAIDGRIRGFGYDQVSGTGDGGHTVYRRR